MSGDSPFFWSAMARRVRRSEALVSTASASDAPAAGHHDGLRGSELDGAGQPTVELVGEGGEAAEDEQEKPDGTEQAESTRPPPVLRAWHGRMMRQSAHAWQAGRRPGTGGIA